MVLWLYHQPHPDLARRLPIRSEVIQRLLAQPLPQTVAAMIGKCKQAEHLPEFLIFFLGGFLLAGFLR